MHRGVIEGASRVHQGVIEGVCGGCIKGFEGVRTCTRIKGFEGVCIEGSSRGSRGHRGVVEGSRGAKSCPLVMCMASFEVHPSRKVSLDKCSHQGVAHWHQYTLHGDPSIQGSSFS